MNRLVVLAMAGVVTLTFTACGGEVKTNKKTTTTTTESVAPAPVAPAAPAAPVAPVAAPDAPAAATGDSAENVQTSIQPEDVPNDDAAETAAEPATAGQQ